MSILSICVIAIVSVVLSLCVKKYNSELSLLISISCAVIILLCVIDYVLSCVDSVSSIIARANIDKEYILILLKVMGICFITEFTCDCTKEAGLFSLSGNIALAGKIIVLITSMPMFLKVLNIVTSLSGGDVIE